MEYLNHPKKDSRDVGGGGIQQDCAQKLSPGHRSHCIEEGPVSGHRGENGSHDVLDGFTGFSRAQKDQNLAPKSILDDSSVTPSQRTQSPKNHDRGDSKLSKASDGDDRALGLNSLPKISSSVPKFEKENSQPLNTIEEQNADKESSSRGDGSSLKKNSLSNTVSSRSGKKILNFD